MDAPDAAEVVARIEAAAQSDDPALAEAARQGVEALFTAHLPRVERVCRRFAGDPATQVAALRSLAILDRAGGDTAGAQEWLDAWEAVDGVPAAAEAARQVEQARLHTAVGRPQAAHGAWERAAALQRDLGDRIAEAHIRLEHAALARATGAHDRAGTLLERALAMARAAGAGAALSGRVLWRLSEVRRLQGSIERADVLAAQARALLPEPDGSR